MTFIEAINLIFSYKTYKGDREDPEEHIAIQDVSLQVEKGNFVGILGHNGSGKSTLAKQLAGLLCPTSGVIYVNGFNTAKEENVLLVRKSTGMIFQNPDNQLIGNTVEEDVAFGPENLGVPREDIWKRVVDALEAVGMSAYIERSPNTLSGGQKQKIAIAGIMAMQPGCIILDEPTAMLDPKGRQEVMEAIHSLNKEKGITILLITHHVEEVQEADYLYVMDHGKLKAQGTPAELWQEAELLQGCGVALTLEQRLIHSLQQKGLEIPEHVRDREEIINYVCDEIAKCDKNNHNIL